MKNIIDWSWEYSNDGRRAFYVNDWNRWAHQNDAEYTGDYFDGTLNDNFMLACKRGWVMVKEVATTGWFTGECLGKQLYVFAPYDNQQACDNLWDEWKEMRKEAEQWEAAYEAVLEEYKSACA